MIHQVASRLFSRVILGAAAAVVFCGSLGAADEPGQDKEQEARREQQLKNMQRSAAQYTLSSADTPKRIFKFHDTAALRFSNPVSGTNDGALYLWTDHGRPQAILKFYTSSHKAYTHVWLSLSENSFVAERDGKLVWSPSTPGIELREIQGAPKPAETAAKRLRQMRALSDEFSSTYTATHLDAKPFELRLLTQPLLRYETDDEYRADGTLFAFVQSTAPVGLLLLESRLIQDGYRWHYACSSLIAGQLAARYRDQQVFFLDRNNTARDAKEPYVMFHALPIPKE